MAIRALDDDSETPVPKLPSTFRFLGDVSSGNSVPSNKDEGAVVAGVRGAAEGVVPGFAGLAGFGAGMKAAAPMAARASAMVPGIGVPGLATKALVGGAVAITGGLAGAFGAQAMGNPAAWGLDAAVPAAFLGLLWPRLQSSKDRAVALCAITMSLVLTPFVPAGVPIISTALLAVIFGARGLVQK